MAPRPEYYVAAPPGPPMYPAPPVYQQQQAAPSSAIPWWAWMAAGFAAAKATEMVSAGCCMGFCCATVLSAPVPCASLYKLVYAADCQGHMMSSTLQRVHRHKLQHETSQPWTRLPQSSLHSQGCGTICCSTCRELRPHTTTTAEILMVDFSLQVQSLVKKGPQQMMAEMVSKLKRAISCT